MQLEITDVNDLRAGDIATFEYASRKYTGPVFVDKDNDLRFMDWVVLWDRKGASSLADLFVSATRAVPALPTEPLSVITDVVTKYGDTYPLAVFDGTVWNAFTPTKDYATTYYPDSIVSFKLGKVVND